MESSGYSWLESKFGCLTNESSEIGDWSSISIAAQMTQQRLREILDRFFDLPNHIKLKLLCSVLHLPATKLTQCCHELDDILSHARQDTDEWVSTVADLLRDYPTTFALSLHLNDDESEGNLFQKTAQQLRSIVSNYAADVKKDMGVDGEGASEEREQHLLIDDELQSTSNGLSSNSLSVSLLPNEAQYVNKSVLNSWLGVPPLPDKLFALKRKPKSAMLRAELVNKSVEVAMQSKSKSGLSGIAGGSLSSVVPIKSRISVKKGNNSMPLRGVPTQNAVKQSAGFGQTRTFSRPATSLKKQGGVKFIEIEETPEMVRKKRKEEQVAEKEAQKQKKEVEREFRQQAAEQRRVERQAASKARRQQLALERKLSSAAEAAGDSIDELEFDEEDFESDEFLKSDIEINGNLSDFDNRATCPILAQPKQIEHSSSSNNKALIVPPRSDSVSSGAQQQLPPLSFAQPPQQKPPPNAAVPTVAAGPRFSLLGFYQPAAGFSGLSSSTSAPTPAVATASASGAGATLFNFYTQQLTSPTAANTQVANATAAIAASIAPSAASTSLAPHLAVAGHNYTASTSQHSLQLPSNGAVSVSGQQQAKTIKLTKETISEAQELFKNANKLSRPEKAVILGFMAGNRENPYPHLGPILSIQLSEAREFKIVNAPSVLGVVDGRPAATAAALQAVHTETYFQMNYDTGQWSKYLKQRPLTSLELQSLGGAALQPRLSASAITSS